MNFVTVFAAEEVPVYDPDKVTPGVLGFAAIALVAVAVIFLLLDMNRRVRRIQFREQVREELAQEVADRDTQSADGADPAPEEAASAEPADAAETRASDAADPDQNPQDNAGR
ncbi:hypothetical protein [Leucobacter sp. CX169]|uniref:hypothetical protein n=1 Tax=Leucobacter sp. CX169 TaxID=2813744 RepID=UPI0019CFD9F8|nr:hypothetical protein [Leucobacter sp. CX169]